MVILLWEIRSLYFFTRPTPCTSVQERDKTPLRRSPWGPCWMSRMGWRQWLSIECRNALSFKRSLLCASQSRSLLAAIWSLSMSLSYRWKNQKSTSSDGRDQVVTRPALSEEKPDSRFQSTYSLNSFMSRLYKPALFLFKYLIFLNYWQ